MKDNYKTPDWLMEVFEHYDDPCPLNADFNGLKEEWASKNYVNPPYSNPLPWVEKAIRENRKGKTVVMLLPVDTSTKWFAKLVEAKAHFLWFAQRIRFIKGSPRFASMLVILTNSQEIN